MSKNNNAIVLGGTYPHRSLIKKLKERGYYTILVDYYENPPAKEVADEHVMISTLDKDLVLQVAKENDAKLVISTCIDQANVTACYVSEKLGLPIPYSYETALNVSNKILMKSIMVNSGIPTSKFLKVKSLLGVRDHDLEYPVIVKPADSNSSKGVRKAINYTELCNHLNEALRISKDNEAVVEEFKIGKEIGLDCIIKNKKASIILTRERIKIVGLDDSVQQIYGSFFPALLSQDLMNEFEHIANKIADVFDLDNTPLLIQAIVNKDEINVIEFAPRIGGGENHNIIQMSTGFDIINAGIESFLNKDINLEYSKPVNMLFDCFIYANPGIFGGVTGFENLVKDNIAEYFSIFKHRGTVIGQDLSSNNRVGVFTVKDRTRDEILSKILRGIEMIDVYDTEGKSIFLKRIYSGLISNKHN